MVKFGYASDVSQMVQRMKYDLLYIENMSLAIDFKIMFYTVLIIFQGKGNNACILNFICVFLGEIKFISGW